MSIVLFNVAPQLIDIVVACTYLAVRLQPWAAVIVFVTVRVEAGVCMCVLCQSGRACVHLRVRPAPTWRCASSPGWQSSSSSR